MDENNKNKDVIHTLIIGSVVMIGKILGFVKQSIIAWAFGANSLTDVYFAADGYTSLYAQIMSASTSPTILTRYVKLEADGEKAKANELVQQGMLLFMLLGAILVVLNIVFSSKICDLIGLSYTVEQKETLRLFLIFLCPVIIFATLSGVAGGYLDANRQFVPGKIGGLFFSVSIIISIILFKNILGLKSLLYGFILGYFFYTLFLMLIINKQIGISIINPFRKPEFNILLSRFVPLVIGNSIVDLGHLVDKIIASSLDTGSVSVLYYGQVISSDIVYAVIITSVGTVLFTVLTRVVSSVNDNSIIVDKLRVIICMMTVITGIIFALYIVEGLDLIKIFFERGSFDSQNSEQVFSVAVFYSIGFCFMANREVMIKAHYAYQDTLTPMINSIIGVIINIAGSVFFSKIIGISGVAFATSLSMIVVFTVSLFTIKKHLGYFIINKKVFADFIKIIISVFITIIIGKYLNSVNREMHIMIRMVFVSGVMFIIYILFLMILRENVIEKGKVKINYFINNWRGK